MHTHSVTCTSPGNGLTNPRLSINGGWIPIDDILLTNELLSTTLTAPDGLGAYDYYGYFNCTAGSTSIGNIIHYSKCQLSHIAPN